MSLKDKCIDILTAQYDAKRRNAAIAQRERISRIFDECPQIKELNKTLAHNSVERARRSLNGDESALDGIREESEMISRQKQAILVKAGYPADYLDIKYECPICKDTGYVDGKKCSCFKKALSLLLLERSNMTQLLTNAGFDKFDISLFSDDESDFDEFYKVTPRSNIKHILEKVRTFIDDFDTKPGNIIISGQTGVGKTFLSSCIAREIIDRSHTVLYNTAVGLFRTLEDRKFGKIDTMVAKEAENEIYDCDLLIIDDLGSEFYTSFSATSFFTVINERLLSGKSTIISTNLSSDEMIERYSERTYSRILQNYYIMKIFGKDLRTEL